ncbi:zinc finger domain-containing protein [Trichoderma compactum]
MEIEELTTSSALTQLERIGQGRCGTVWAARCSTCDDHGHLAMKRGDGSTTRSISYEYQVHQKIATAFKGSNFSSFAIPRSIGFLDVQDNAAWSDVLPRLPSDYTACNAIISEKIVPVNASTRRLLVQKFRPDINVEEIMRSQSNEHCLIRPYLGRRRYHQSEIEATTGGSRRRLPALSLRNYPLHLDQMEQLGIDPSGYAVAMADALAFLHWIAQVDGNDVEFVLAQPRRQSDLSSSTRPGGIYSNNTAIFGPHMMWILDFDLCRDISLDEEGVKKAHKAFWGNDPFFPQPGRGNPADQRLWTIFQDRYIESSAAVLHEEAYCIKRLPGLLIEQLKRTKAVSSS